MAPESTARPPAGPALRDALLDAYPSLAAVPRDALDAAIAATPALDVPRGTLLFREGDPCRAFPFVLDGEIRVARGTPEGRSIELYRVGPGEVCLLSTSCAFSMAGSTGSWPTNCGKAITKDTITIWMTTKGMAPQ